jgi:hypothetical protein
VRRVGHWGEESGRQRVGGQLGPNHQELTSERREEQDGMRRQQGAEEREREKREREKRERERREGRGDRPEVTKAFNRLSTS